MKHGLQGKHSVIIQTKQKKSNSLINYRSNSSQNKDKSCPEERKAFNIYFRLTFIFLYQKSFQRTFKTRCLVQCHFLICLIRLLIQKGYFVAKKLVWNVCIKDFWYINFVTFRYTCRTTLQLLFIDMDMKINIIHI